MTHDETLVGLLGDAIAMLEQIESLGEWATPVAAAEILSPLREAKDALAQSRAPADAPHLRDNPEGRT